MLHPKSRLTTWSLKFSKIIQSETKWILGLIKEGMIIFHPAEAYELHFKRSKVMLNLIWSHLPADADGTELDHIWAMLDYQWLNQLNRQWLFVSTPSVVCEIHRTFRMG